MLAGLRFQPPAALPARARPNTLRPRCTLAGLCASRRRETSKSFSIHAYALRQNLLELAAPSSLTRAGEGVRAWQALSPEERGRVLAATAHEHFIADLDLMGDDFDVRMWDEPSLETVRKELRRGAV